MTTLSIPNNAVTGETATAAKFNANMSAIEAVVNGGIDNTNITDGGIDADCLASGIITSAKISTALKSSARAYLSTAQSLASSASYQKITLDGEDFDVLGEYNTTNKRFVAASTGKYIVNGAITFGGNASGLRGIEIYVNGAAKCRGVVVAGTSLGYQTVVISDILSLTAADYVELYGFQNSGPSIALNNDIRYTYMSIHIIV